MFFEAKILCKIPRYFEKKTDITICMEDYRRTTTSVSMVNYHFVFCPRYRRKIFKIPGLEAFFKQKVFEICEQNDLHIIALECHIDHCHLFVNAPPKLSPAQIMKLIKGGTGYALKEKFFQTKKPQVWTRSYFVATAGNASNETVQRYVESQKTRPAKKMKKEVKKT